MKFRKKPVVIDAVQWTGSNEAEVSDFMGSSPTFKSDPTGGYTVGIVTLEGTVTASMGDWIIRGVKGENYPCKPDIFAATYDEVVA